MSTIAAFIKTHHYFFRYMLGPIVAFRFLFLFRVVFFAGVELFWPLRKLS